MIKFHGRLFSGGNTEHSHSRLRYNDGSLAVVATIATYLMFTAIAGECIVREYLFRPCDTPVESQEQ